MKKITLCLGVGFIAMAMLPSCGKDAKEQKTSVASKNTTPAAQTAEQGTLPNYRFVNVDSIGLKYNLAVDFNEQMISLQNNIAEEEKKQQNLAQSKLSALEKRAQAAQQMTDMNAARSQMEGIQKEAEEVQRQAQQKMADVGSNAEKQIANNAKILQDSLTNFLRDYAQEKGYDAIFVNQTAPYYNPALDITDEVIEGLNARYNKVKK